MTRKMPWESHPHIWKTKASFFNYLRGGLRRGLWERSPAKLDFKTKNLIKPPADYVGRGKSGQYCALDNEFTINSKLEVDHIEGNVSLKDWDDVLDFIIHLTCVDGNLQLVNKENHKIKSYAEKQGITFEQAVIEKQIIALMKGKVSDINKDILKRGGSEKDIKNKDTRKAFYREVVINSK